MHHGPCKSTRPRDASRVAGALCALALSASPALAQCTPEWTFYYPELHSSLWALDVHDGDDAGPVPPALYTGGRHLFASGMPADLVARFDGWQWSAPQQGLGPQDMWMRAFVGIGDEHPDPAMRGLWAGGKFSSEPGPPASRTIARWDGTRWNFPPVQPPWTVLELAVFDENKPGPAPLFAGGVFFDIGTAMSIEAFARWDGNVWTEVGGKMRRSNGGGANASAMQVWDDDASGPRPPALYVGGHFDRLGPLEIHNIARWDGNAWQSLGGYGTAGPVFALAPFDADGPGPEPEYLYVGGGFAAVGGPPGSPNRFTVFGLARWDGNRWSEVPGWPGGFCSEMVVMDIDGPGPEPRGLYVYGPFTQIGGKPAQGLARWDGSTWEPIMPGRTGIGEVRSMGFFDEDGAGPNPGGLYVGGDFWTIGNTIAAGLARWGCPLAPRCLADCDQSTGGGRLDVFDWLCFQTRFVSQDPYACDCDVSTGYSVCDIFDFLCFQNAFVAGCP
jgi:hypothetical protein